MGRARKDPSQPEDTAGLTYRQRLFVAAYLGEANGNGTDAARIAGYACPLEQASDNLTKPAIQAAIAAKLDSASLNADEVLARLSDIASGDFSPYVKIVRGKPSVDLQAMIDAGHGHLIKAIKQTKFGVNIEFHDPVAALDKLGRYHALFIERSEVSGPSGGPIPVDIETTIEQVYGDRGSGANTN